MAVRQKSSVTAQAPLIFSVLYNFVAFSASLGRAWKAKRSNRKWVHSIRLDIFKGDNQMLNELGCYCPHVEPKAAFG